MKDLPSVLLILAALALVIATIAFVEAPRRVSECADYIFRLSHRGDCP